MKDVQKARDFRNYKIWQDAVDYATCVYEITEQMPWFEKKGLCDQLRRAVVSISSNIAEGSAKPSDVDFARFLDQALGSAYEVADIFTTHKYKIRITYKFRSASYDRWHSSCG